MRRRALQFHVFRDTRGPSTMTQAWYTYCHDMGHSSLVRLILVHTNRGFHTGRRRQNF